MEKALYYIDEKTGKIRLVESIKRKFERAGYRFYGHSAVQICHWTKEGLKGRPSYKKIFYNIDCHRCMQFSPAAIFCQNRCIFCWRQSEYWFTIRMPEEYVDDPKDIIDNLIKLRKELLMGYKGNPYIDKKLWEESLIPSHFSISLSGEPTLYPKLPEMIKYIRSLPFARSIFLATNGQEPEMLERLIEEDALPTQLILTTTASNEEDYKKISVPLYKDGWERWLRSAKLLRKMKTRTLMKIVLIKGLNDKNLEEYAEIIEKANPRFVQVKAYMYLGYSQKYLKPENSPTHEYVKEFANKLLEYLPNFHFEEEVKVSRVVLLQNDKRYTNRFIDSICPNVE